MGRGSKNGFSNLSPVFAQIKGLKKGENAHIEFSIKDENDDLVIQDSESGISGKLVGVLDASYPHEGSEVAQGKLILEDEEEGEVYFLSFGISMVGVSIINSIAGCNNPGEIDISLWNDKATGYAKVFVKNNGEKTEWAYAWDDLKDKVTYSKVKQKGKMVDVRDDWDLKQFMLKDVLLTEIADKLPKRAKATPKPEVEAENEPEGSNDEPEILPPSQQKDEGDDLPF